MSDTPPDIGLETSLSQDAVDALVSAYADEAPDAPTAYSYDFKRPNRISKDQLRTLLSIHDSFARIFSNSLSAVLRTFVEIQVESIDQVTYSEAVLALPNPTSLFVFDENEGDHKGFLEINLPLVFSVIDRLFGGRGRTVEHNRELTHIEESMCRRIVERAFEDLATAWKPFHEITPKLSGTESNPRFIQVAHQNDIVVFLSFKVIMDESYGLLSICLPYLFLEPMLAKMSSTSWFTSHLRGQSTDERNLLVRELQETELDIRALAGRTDISVSDLLDLEAGEGHLARLRSVAATEPQVREVRS